ncbi:MAG: flagellar type III secretion system pore protein FliP [Oscillospiraceae bacterium]|nr:flagellar type III secretion system pore protein FliP [Oscillospiraceae bacterium]
MTHFSFTAAPCKSNDTVVPDICGKTGGHHGFSSVPKLLVLLVLTAVLIAAPALSVHAAVDLVEPVDPVIPGEPANLADPDDPLLNININSGSSDTIRVLLLLTLMTLLPSFLMMMTCFTRFIIVFSLMRNAIGLQQTPPNQVLIGLALIISLFVMAPVITEITETAYDPFSEGEITASEFLEISQVPLKRFMLANTQSVDLALFTELSQIDLPEEVMDYPITTIIPAFMTSEIKRAFIAGFFLFVPFLIIDMVVASSLMSMGMMMLPPITISLPFKLMLFVLVDGWGLLIRSLVTTYRFT